MAELHTTDVPGWLHSSIQGEALVDADLNPARTIPVDSVPVVIAPEYADLFKPSRTHLSLLSPNHGRSYEVGTNQQSRRFGAIGIWLDEFDNNYTSYSLKGNNFTQPEVYESSTAPSGYIAHGLLENDSLLRAIRASRIFREAGIETEWINRVFEPQELIFKGERVSPDEYKQHILEEAAKQNGIEEMAAIAKAIAPMSFYVTGRSMQINDRINDYLSDPLMHPRLKHTFRVYNATHQNDDDFEPLEIPTSNNGLLRTSVERYFGDILPKQIGKNFARIHNLGLVHKFPHLGNITTLGGFVDLDSITGPALELDDEPNATRMKIDDLMFHFRDDEKNNFDKLYALIERRGIFPEGRSANKALETLHESYMNNRVFDESEDSLRESIAMRAINLKAIDHMTIYDDFEKLTKANTERFVTRLTQLIKAEFAAMRTDKSLYQSLRNITDYSLTMMAEGMLKKGSKLTNVYSMMEELVQIVAPSETKSFSEERINTLAHSIALNQNEKIIYQYLRPIANIYTQYKLLRGLISSMNREIGADLSEQEEAELAANIKRVQEKFMVDFKAEMSDDDFESYARTIPDFYCIDDLEEADVIVANHKTLYAFDSVSFTRLINSARKANVDIVLADLKDTEPYSVGRKEDAPRNTFTDAKSTTLQQIMLPNDDYVIAVQGPDSTYIAWLYEPVNPGERPILEIEHVNKKKALKQLSRSGYVDVA